jgi:hypothetical protein
VDNSFRYIFIYHFPYFLTLYQCGADYTGSIGSFELQIVLGAEGEGTSMVWIILVLLPYLNYNEL